MSGMHDDQERLTEALSAYLDGALDGAERDTLERHLATCEACRAELAGLRHVGALLRALPEPVMPRSFTLPATATQAGRPAARRALGWARAAQWVGGLAAALGAGLLVAGMIPPSQQSASVAAPERPYAQGGSSSAATTDRPTHTPDLTQATGATKTPSPSWGGSTPGTVGTGSIPTQIPTPGVATGVDGRGAGAPLIPTGATLLVGGGAALAAGSVSRRRARRRVEARQDA